MKKIMVFVFLLCITIIGVHNNARSYESMNIQQAKQSFKMIKKAHQRHDENLLRKYLSKEIFLLFGEGTIIWLKDIEFIAAEENDLGVLITVREFHNNNMELSTK
ncbi:MAG: hypothetical protein GF384_03555 [Elusimicrobia bacterium]|nr:hypothetical protein [Elusimicrobiota bacterium]MBD3411989.1 hypothetical protein [Elusimicrobiota bacterium]